MLKRIQNTLFEIKDALLSDQKIRKLLYYDNADALDLEDIPIPENPGEVDVVDQYITLFPIFDIENAENYSQNAIINIEIDSGDKKDLVIDGVLRVNIVVKTDKWVLENNQIRPLELVNRAIKILDNSKFSTSNKLEFDSFVQLIVSKKLVGYSMLFSIIDGNGELNKF